MGLSGVSARKHDGRHLDVDHGSPGNRGDLESALPTRPNLLLTMGGGGRATVIARRMGLKTLDLPFPATIDDVDRNLSGGRGAWRSRPRRCRGGRLSGLRRTRGRAARRHLPWCRAATASARRRSKRNGCGWRAFGSARCPAAAPAWSCSLPARRRSCFARPIGTGTLARPDLARPSACPAQGIAHCGSRRPAMDLRRAIDARRGRAIAGASVRLLIDLLADRSVRRRICFCRWHPCAKPRQSTPDLADLILVELRLPRTLLVLGYGAVLGISGAALAGDLRQPARLARHQRRLERSGARRGARRLLARLDPAARARGLRRGRGAWNIGPARHARRTHGRYRDPASRRPRHLARRRRRDQPRARPRPLARSPSTTHSTG